MLSFTRSVAFCLLAIFIVLPSAAQDLAARLQTAAAAGDLDGITEKPWYLKLEVTTFDADGKNPQQGTVEVKNIGGDRHTTYIFGDARHSELRSGSRRFELQRGEIPYFAEVALAHVLHMGPSADELKDVEYELQRTTLNKVPIDCILIGHQMKAVAVIKPGIFPAYCLQRDTGVLRLTYDYGSQLTVVNSIGKFLDHDVPVSIAISENGETVANAKVTTLGTFTPAPKDYAPEPGEVEVGWMRPRIGGGVMAGKLLTRTMIRIPPDVKKRQPHGTVTLHVVIGRDGHVHAIRPVTFPDPDLVALTMASVRNWTYSPYTSNDIPTDVETTISINFGQGNVDVIGIRH